ncbi:MAG: YqaJ viral recombinase family protein [Methylocella sp.]
MTGIEIIVPASRAAWLLLRKLSIGASEIAALLNRHPWMTPFELWAEKSDLAPPVKETLDMELGAHIESVALKFLSKRRPDWIVTPNVIGEGGNFFLDRRAGLSCTPDAFVTPSEARGLGVCQVKKVSARVFREKWCNGGDPEVPSYVAIQVNQEAALTHATWGCVAALVIGEFSSEFYLLEVPLHAGVIARIHVEANKFWHRVAENDPPPPDYGRDGDIIRHIYAEDDGGEIDLSGNETVMGLLARREELKLIESAGSSAEKERAAIDRRLVHEFLGNAVRGMVGDGRVIEARTIRRAGYAVEPSHYRQVRIKAPREWSAAA